MSELSTNIAGKLKKVPLKWVIPGGVVLVLAIILAVSMITVTAGDTIRQGISIAGIDVSKMSVDQAKEAVNQRVNEFLQNNTVTTDYEGNTQTFAFRELLTQYKVDQAVEQAYATGRNGNFFTNSFASMGLRFQKKDIAVEPDLDEGFITQFIDSYAMNLDTPLEENIYRVEKGKLRLHNGKKGYAIDKAKAIEDIKNILMTGQSGTVLIQKTEQEPAPFDVDKIYQEVCTPPVDARYETRDGKTFLVEAQNGYTFDKDKLRAVIQENRETQETFYMELEVIEPNIKTVDTSGLFKEQLSSYTSKITDSNSNRLNNVRLATEKINGVILNPGEVFYYLKHVEPITVAGGYKVANVYVDGKIEQDIGGGVCQVSSALYSAVLYADLEVVKRYNHSLTVGYVPYGMDATVSSGEIDFRFKNSTNAPMKIVATMDKHGVYIRLMGEKPDKSLTVEIDTVTVKTLKPETIVKEDPTLPEGKVEVETKGRVGYVVDTYKNYYRNGSFVERVFVSKSTYRSIDEVQRKGVAPAAATPAVATQPPAAEPTKPPAEPPAEPTPQPTATEPPEPEE